MDLGGLVDLIETVFAIFACATLLSSFVAAAYGVQYEAQPDTTIIRKLLAMLCGCLVGVAVAAFIGIASLGASASTDSVLVLVLGLVLGPLFGAWMSYGVAGKVAAGTYPP